MGGAGCKALGLSTQRYVNRDRIFRKVLEGAGFLRFYTSQNPGAVGGLKMGGGFFVQDALSQRLSVDRCDAFGTFA